MFDETPLLLSLYDYPETTMVLLTVRGDCTDVEERRIVRAAPRNISILAGGTCITRPCADEAFVFPRCAWGALSTRKSRSTHTHQARRRGLQGSCAVARAGGAGAGAGLGLVLANTACLAGTAVAARVACSQCVRCYLCYF